MWQRLRASDVNNTFNPMWPKCEEPQRAEESNQGRSLSCILVNTALLTKYSSAKEVETGLQLMAGSGILWVGFL